MTYKLIVFYKGLEHKHYYYPLKHLCPGTYYYVHCTTYDSGVELHFPHLNILPIFLINATWEKEFE